MAKPASHLDPSVVAYVNHPGIARLYDAYFARHPLFAYDTEFVHRHIPPGSRVLDLGAGTGRHLVALARRGDRVVGLDLSAHMLAAAREKLRNTRLHAPLVQADMLRLPLADSARFDAILLMFSTLGMVHGAERRLEFLRSLRCFLAPEGRLLLHVHNDRYRFSPHKGRMTRLAEVLGVLLDRIEPGDHILRRYRGLVDLRLHSFSLGELMALVEDAGLRLAHLEGLNDRRDGPCEGEDIDRHANGFLLVAVPG
ncbi:MAG: class I SAM-dependent methyltransferase [Planctomycetota bacterium]